MQKARRPHYRSDRLQTYGFRVFSLRFLRFFSPFPHGTCSLSVSQEYLALPDGAGTFRQNFSGSALLDSLLLPFMYGTFTLFGIPFQVFPLIDNNLIGLVRFRSPLLTESLLISFPPGTQMFQFPGFAKVWSSTTRVTPFRHLRINPYLLVPAAFRSLSRPSQPLRAQASPVRPSLLFFTPFCKVSRAFREIDSTYYLTCQ